MALPRFLNKYSPLVKQIWNLQISNLNVILLDFLIDSTDVVSQELLQIWVEWLSEITNISIT